ncbi:MAG: S53 family peptidase [Candidatus Sulfotelmatobacter sp.]
MKRSATVLVVLSLFTLLISGLAVAQDDGTSTPQQPAAQPAYQAAQGAIYRQPGTAIVPQSSVERAEDAGLRAHTNYEIFVPAGRTQSSITPDNTFAESPSSLACVYGVGTKYTGCTPAGGTSANNASGGWGGIALVDAYDYPTATTDLAYFSSYFGLPAATFAKVIANSSFGTLGGLKASCSGTPQNGKVTGWDVEEALDIEWAHAMAPSAHIFLVEACTSSLNDLLYAEYVAGEKVNALGGGDISNSWSTAEFVGEVGTTDQFFYYYYWNNISYFASAGDSGWGAAYPSSSPWVVSAGGTTINRDSIGNFLNESCWSGSGGGVSAYETWQNPPNISNGMGPWTDYQYSFAGQGARQTPDISFDADPNSGVYVYDTDEGGTWYVVGGTSVASPSLAGIVNNAENKFGQGPVGGGKYTPRELNEIYSQLRANRAYHANFYDVTTGSNGTGHNAGTGYDQCTGVGSPRGKLGK